MRALVCLLASLLCGLHSSATLAQLDLSEVLGGEAQGFEAVSGPRPMRFPRDHGAHPRFRSEWWYATGQLTTARGRRFGLQLTLFRHGLHANANADANANANSDHRGSDWRADAIWMGHMAVTDVAAGRFHPFQRFARGARLGIAGASVSPTRIWLRDWVFEHDDVDTWRMRAAQAETGLDISVRAAKPLVLQGEAGYSRKSEGPGRASHYYAYTRLEGAGAVTVSGQRHEGTVRMWLDREWSSGALAPGQAGWDWFGLQLDDGQDLMVYRLRLRDGASDPLSAGAVVSPEGARLALSGTDFDLQVLRLATLATGRRYPVSWRVRVPHAGLDLVVEAVLDEQEHAGALPYWEGLVDVRRNGRSAGHGYLEMTGY